MIGVRCLVLGGGGFLGINLCNALAARGANVSAFGRSLAFEGVLDRRVSWTRGHLNDAHALRQALCGQAIVFHLANTAVPGKANKNPLADIDANVRTTVQLLDLFLASGCGRLIFASSGGTVYGAQEMLPIPENAPAEPISAYGIGKLMSEKYVSLYRHLHALDYRILRIANAYGPYQAPGRGQGVVPTMIERALKGEPLEIWGTGDAVRDLVYVDDVVDAMIGVCAYDGPHRVMNVGSGQGISVNRIASDIARLAASKPLAVVRKPALAADVPANVLDPSLIARELGWRPAIIWQEGLGRTMEWVSKAYLPQYGRNLPVEGAFGRGN